MMSSPSTTLRGSASIEIDVLTEMEIVRNSFESHKGFMIGESIVLER